MQQGETPDELRAKLTNYKQTRRTAAGSMYRWLDALIEDAETKLRQLCPESAATAAEGGDGFHGRDHRHRDLRSTYPFDENAPRQRPA